LALLDGRIGEGERLIDEASALGKRIGEPDEVNVGMTLTLGARWARGDPDELLEFAERAVAWWVGIPAYSYAVAAGFLTLGGALEDARRALAVSRELDEWKEDRSLLRSAFVGLSVGAGARLGDRELCAELYDELADVAGTCAVNGAVVCFMGSYAHWAGVAAAALGHLEDAVGHLEVARRHPPHRGRSARAGRPPRPLRDDGDDLPVPARRTRLLVTSWRLATNATRFLAAASFVLALCGHRSTSRRHHDDRPDRTGRLLDESRDVSGDRRAAGLR
jgi:hypothetical protein